MRDVPLELASLFSAIPDRYFPINSANYRPLTDFDPSDLGEIAKHGANVALLLKKLVEDPPPLPTDATDEEILAWVKNLRSFVES